ncbi:hypothetical protein ACIOK4_13610 [Streptomyces bottropensis]
MKRIDQPTQQPSPAQLPTAPLPPAAQAALARLERALRTAVTK